MELEGLKGRLIMLENVGVIVNYLVMDRYFMVKKYMRIVYFQKKYYFDVWYMVKGRVFLLKYYNVYIIQYVSISIIIIYL